MLKRLLQRQRFMGDFILNLLASFITTGIAQLVLYPVLAKFCPSEEYGEILTIMGVGNTVIATFGNSLNNVRLMLNYKYEERKETGDYLPLSIILGLFGGILFALYILLCYRLSLYAVVILVIFVILGSIRTYGTVAYRIVLDYKKNLICSISIAVGYVCGLLIIRIANNWSLWPIAFVTGEIAGLTVIILNSTIFREPFKKTSLIQITINKEIVLLLTTLGTSLLTYLDRLLLLPLLGGLAVSIYTVASFFGKSLGILMTPMASVLLSYYSQKNYKMTFSRFWKTNCLVLALSAVFFLISLIASRWITGLLYPSLILQAMPYLVIANLSAILNVTANMTQPAVLKFAPTYWQLVIQVFFFATYLGLGVVMAKLNGINGFSWAALIANISRLLLLYAVGSVAIRKEGIVAS